MTPIHSQTLDGITRAVSRHYLRPLTLDPVPGQPDRWAIRIKDRTDPVGTEVVRHGDTYTFQNKTRVPQWDREIENETP